MQQLEEACSDLPSQQEAEQMLQQLRAFREQWNAIRWEAQSLPEEPQQPQLPAPFAGMEPMEAREMAEKDGRVTLVSYMEMV